MQGHCEKHHPFQIAVWQSSSSYCSASASLPRRGRLRLRPPGPRIDLTVQLSREGQLYPVTYAEFYLAAADPIELLKAAGLRLNRDLSDGEHEGG